MAFRITAFKNNVEIGSVVKPNVLQAESAASRFFIPDTSRAFTNARLHLPETQTGYLFAPGDEDIAADRVEVFYNNRPVITFTPADNPPPVNGDVEQFLGKRIARALTAVADLPPLPSGKRQREALAVLREGILDLDLCLPDTAEEVALKMFDKLRPYLK